MSILLMGGIVGFIVAVSIGANDVANSMATAVGARAINIRQAVVIAAILEFTGAAIFGSQVTETIRKGIVDPAKINDPNAFMLGAFSALIATATWILIATYFGLPVSTTHSIVGAMAGFGIAAAGWSVVNWIKIVIITLSWILSPIAGLFVSFLMFKSISAFILHSDRPFKSAKRYGPWFIGGAFMIIAFSFVIKVLKGSFTVGFIVATVVFVVSGFFIYIKLKRRRVLSNEYDEVEKIFKKMQVITSCYVALAHGANDVANAIGPVAAIYAVYKGLELGGKVTVPRSILMIGGLGIAVGVALWGSKVMKTVGEGITALTNTRGFSIDFSTATIVLTASILGLPVSTTHTVVGAVVGVGLARGVEAVNLKILKNILISWFLTVPAAAVLSMLIFKILIFLGG